MIKVESDFARQEERVLAYMLRQYGLNPDDFLITRDQAVKLSEPAELLSEYDAHVA